jgi:hypothetical protein
MNPLDLLLVTTELGVAMNAEQLHARFARMGARLKLIELFSRDRQAFDRPLTLDVHSDANGEYFAIGIHYPGRVELDVVDLRRRDEHLLLRGREQHGEHHFLCGRDERHWFVAAIPEARGAISSVLAAMEALKPPEVLEAQRHQGVKGKDRQRRKNAAYVRQGEWFFLPAPALHVDKKQVLFNEPLSRGAGNKPHWAEFLFRRGGEAVYVCDQYPQGVRPATYLAMLRERPRIKSWSWRYMVRNPEAFVKGEVSHPDHKTIDLQVWHKVVMNTEGQAQAMKHVVFLD